MIKITPARHQKAFQCVALNRGTCKDPAFPSGRTGVLLSAAWRGRGSCTFLVLSAANGPGEHGRTEGAGSSLCKEGGSQVKPIQDKSAKSKRSCMLPATRQSGKSKSAETGRGQVAARGSREGGDEEGKPRAARQRDSPATREPFVKTPECTAQ